MGSVTPAAGATRRIGGTQIAEVLGDHAVELLGEGDLLDPGGALGGRLLGPRPLALTPAVATTVTPAVTATVATPITATIAAPITPTVAATVTAAIAAPVTAAVATTVALGAPAGSVAAVVVAAHGDQADAVVAVHLVHPHGDLVVEREHLLDAVEAAPAAQLGDVH